MDIHNHADAEVKSFHVGLSDDLAALLGSDESSSKCWCMWFIGTVKDFHTAGSVGNRARFEALARSAPEPMGLLAYRAGNPVGWCAIGPMERFARAMRTPTLRGYAAPPGKTWFAPCFYIHPEHRRNGITRLLLPQALYDTFEVDRVVAVALKGSHAKQSELDAALTPVSTKPSSHFDNDRKGGRVCQRRRAPGPREGEGFEVQGPSPAAMTTGQT